MFSKTAAAPQKVGVNCLGDVAGVFEKIQAKPSAEIF
jgi:hypothetical protein